VDDDNHFCVITAGRWDDCFLYGAFSSIERAVEAASLPTGLCWKQQSASPLELNAWSGDGFRFEITQHQYSSEARPDEVLALCRTYMECTMFEGAFDRLEDAQAQAEQKKGNLEWYREGAPIWRARAAKISVARLRIDQSVQIEMW